MTKKQFEDIHPKLPEREVAEGDWVTIDDERDLPYIVTKREGDFCRLERVRMATNPDGEYRYKKITKAKRTGEITVLRFDRDGYTPWWDISSGEEV